MNIQNRNDRVVSLIRVEESLNRAICELGDLLQGNPDAYRNGLEYRSIDQLQTDILNVHQTVVRKLREEKAR